MPNISGLKWGGAREGSSGGLVTWSVAPAGLTGVQDAYGVDRSDVTAAPGDVLNFPINAALRQAFATWSAAADITFAQVADDGAQVGAGSGADIRIYFGGIDGPAAGSTVAIAFFPPVFPDALSGDILFDAEERGFFANRNSFLNTAIHEIGHAIGLDHIGGVSAIMNPVATTRTTLFPDDVDGVSTIYGAPRDAPLSLALGAGQADLALRQNVADLTITGNDLDNAIKGGGGSELILGGAGDDALRGAGGFDTLVGGAGDDLLNGGGGVDLALISADFDQIVFRADGDLLVMTGEGADSLTATTEVIAFDGEIRVADDLFALFGAFDFTGARDLLTADATGQRLAGLGGADRLIGDAGADRLLGGGGRDTLIGGAGDDILKGGGGRDTLEGGGGDDRLIGGGGRAQLSGGRGDDTLKGGAGRDTIEGGEDDDVMTGGGGRDLFLFRDAGFGADRITDFQAGADRIDLSEVSEIDGLADLDLRQVGDDLLVDLAGFDASVLLVGGADLDGFAARLFLF